MAVARRPDLCNERREYPQKNVDDVWTAAAKRSRRLLPDGWPALCRGVRYAGGA